MAKFLQDYIEDFDIDAISDAMNILFVHAGVRKVAWLDGASLRANGKLLKASKVKHCKELVLKHKLRVFFCEDDPLLVSSLPIVKKDMIDNTNEFGKLLGYVSPNEMFGTLSISFVVTNTLTHEDVRLFEYVAKFIDKRRITLLVRMTNKMNNFVKKEKLHFEANFCVSLVSGVLKIL